MEDSQKRINWLCHHSRRVFIQNISTFRYNVSSLEDTEYGCQPPTLQWNIKTFCINIHFSSDGIASLFFLMCLFVSTVPMAKMVIRRYHEYFLEHDEKSKFACFSSLALTGSFLCLNERRCRLFHRVLRALEEKRSNMIMVLMVSQNCLMTVTKSIRLHTRDTTVRFTVNISRPHAGIQFSQDKIHLFLCSNYICFMSGTTEINRQEIVRPSICKTFRMKFPQW